jgi:hypothetical protein
LNKFNELANLVSGILAKMAAVEQSFSPLKRIKTYFCSAQGQERQNHLFMLSAERALVADLKKKTNFYNRVIENSRQ